MAGLRLVGLRKAYGSVTVVDGVDLAVADGEFLSLLGPSGCGKTTILRMIAGLIDPDEGSILLGEEEITATAVHRRNLGLVFQSYARVPHMTGAENVAYGLRRRGFDKARAGGQVERFLGMVRLHDLAGRYPSQLSGGQQQRVALARALATEPRLLLLDEPLSNLDAQLRDEMRVELKRLQQDLGLTTVFVTHDQSEALTLSDRVVVLNRGRLEQIGTPEDVYRRPANAFVANVIGRTNFAVGTVAEVRDGRATVRLETGRTIVAPADGIAAGRRVRIGLRHEAIRLSRSPVGGENAFPATVVFAAFAGAGSQYVVRIDPGWELQVEAPSADGVLARGDAVHAQWRAEDVLVLPADGER
ncbi:MAG: ABC transporter ATP-binding protein [Alphaproteobacteria bacterium]|nr:ABC transporter ATP-binding protein [Alphaproteobacteria bacterium]